MRDGLHGRDDPTRASHAPASFFAKSPSGLSMTAARNTRSEVMATGTVKWFNMAKGFGFIAPDGGGQDVFVHVSAVERSGLNGLREGQAVSFDVENDPRKNKPSAVNIKPV